MQERVERHRQANDLLFLEHPLGQGMVRELSGVSVQARRDDERAN